ncbi:uncharacterized protein HMPREF1541_00067 [Cyphellophora europaea CBS 101466]|uniref:RNA-binding S4 domain-containing protein n=1 Tax=Cyphellophora europaea (strain CBS 101466) TaxID=1220924 RepID=W2SAZ8_CYPE1|nr:uncharacterized protein HMPREF1541_00067 [Cyphellophora europaea CBS 101466]ETN45886.1 hypothetical protein HMPREF1541_00067 [Cyphellophora europaea CBS 101466]
MRNTATTSLKRPALRMSMSKYNLYNLSRARSPVNPHRIQSFFKQKWVAKSALRNYHGEHIRERQWQRMFSRKLRSVVPMSPDYLAWNDGTVESAGRGSGLKGVHSRPVPRTPYMLQTFAPMERRLDIAIFRALFASSARQARQFVVHGAVTVNGKPMRYPGYLLNPGDMFQVRPESVMYAMGAPKLDEASFTKVVEEEASEEQSTAESSEATEEEDNRTPKEILKDLLTQSKAILSSAKEGLSAKRKQDLRALSKNVRKLMSRAGRSEVETGDVQAQFEEIQTQIRLARDSKESGVASLPSEQSTSQRTEASNEPETAGKENSSTPITITDVKEASEFGGQDESTLRRALQALSINPVDESKPYGTPWTPREYLSAFAFIPRYLEVNQNICAAVYLRHPVARPGMSEVPSPFNEEANANAFTWYLRRR